MKKHEKNKSTIWRNLKRTWKLTKEHNQGLYLGLFFGLILSIIGAIIPLFSAKVLLSASNGLLNDLLKIALIIFIIEISRNIFSYFMSIFVKKYDMTTGLAIQEKVARETIKLETKELDKNSSGLFIDRLTKDTREMSSVFVDLGDTVINLLSNIGVLFAILVVNPTIFIFFVVTNLILFFLEKKRASKWTEADKVRRKIQEKNTGLTGELVRGIRDIKNLNCGEPFLNKMVKNLEEVNQEGYNVAKINTTYRMFIGHIQDIFALSFILLGIYLMKSNQITTSIFVICYMYRGQMSNLLSYSSWTIELLKKYDVSASRVFEIIDSDEFKKEKFGSRHLEKATGNIEFRNVYFGYEENKEVLKGINFKINANETIAFVGKSGEGKTTIFNLLNKLYPVTKGQILIDGIPLDELDKNSIRDNISVISQAPYIFNMTLEENIKMVKSKVTDKEMIEACKIACFDEYVQSLPDKYNTLVGEGGLTLSGGLRQRLAIARALIKKTEIILFDEATSSLDNQTQSKIQQSIKNMKGEYTIIMIAHRLSTVIDANRILFISNGKIVASGTHQYLLTHNKEYKKLYDKENK